ncbi:MAG TPA: DUF4214 domain-containing protein [Sumerlaeia bacterium]|nr:DUF4214 domain-containing protein [Sumerlaeia bacterium]
MMGRKIFVRLCVVAALWGCAAGPVLGQEANLSPPQTPVNLLWIHHSTGANWAQKYDTDGSCVWNDGVAGVRRGPDDGVYATRHFTSDVGGNGEVALYNNNYILHHLSYGSILADGDHYTDYRNWHYKFRRYLDSGDSTNYVNDVGGEDLIHCCAQDISYAEQGTDEFTAAGVSGQTNPVIMFKSCFPNSAIAAPDTSGGLPENPTLAQARTWITGAGYSTWREGGGAAGPINFIQAEYLALLDVFGEARYRDILFVAWVAPPETDSTSAHARALSDWFENQWLADYAYDNVLLFNYWNIHTGEHQASGEPMPAYQQKHNHSRYNPFTGERDYVTTSDADFVDDIRMAFPSGDSHPSHFGGAVATKELIPLLNIQWNRLHNNPSSGATGYPTDGRTAFFMLDSSFSGTLPSGVTKGSIDGVECLIFDGSASAVVDLGAADVVGAGGAFSYCFWYRPNDNILPAVGNYVAVLRKDSVFACHHYAEDNADSHVNTEFGGDYMYAVDHYNNVVDSDTWTHVTFVWDGTNVRFYMDAVQIMETYQASARTVTDNANHLFLGVGNGNLSGGIREVAIYNRALTADEVRRIFNANAPSGPIPSPTATPEGGPSPAPTPTEGPTVEPTTTQTPTEGPTAEPTAALTPTEGPTAEPTTAQTPTEGPSPTPTVTGEEPIRDLIDSFYKRVLGRDPGSSELNGWQTYFNYAVNFNIDVRFIPREMARLFFLSEEYANRNRTDAEFITDCYLVFLNRSPSQTELDNWTSGVWNRSQVMTVFSESEEFANRIMGLFPGLGGNPTRNFVTFMYIGLLDRLVDQSGLDYAAGLFDAANASGGIASVRAQAVQMAREVIQSSEFLSNNPTTTVYVTRFYRAFLGRFPNDTEVTYWAGELDAQRETYESVIWLFAESPEFTARLEAYF